MKVPFVFTVVLVARRIQHVTGNNYPPEDASFLLHNDDDDDDDVDNSNEPPLYPYKNELLDMPLHTIENNFTSPLPHTYINPDDLPESFSWGNVNGISYLTHSLNQHIPQYCGSCWAHAALSALADRIKIARKGQGDDINLSIQYLLNCGQNIAGSCHGGNITGAYQLVQQVGYIPYDTCQPYLACSEESTEGFCPYIDTTCTPENVCRTCTGIAGRWNLHCTEIDSFPNATIAEYGIMMYPNVSMIQAEIYARGPVAVGLAGAQLSNYRGGIFDDTTAPRNQTHAVSIVGWGTDDSNSKNTNNTQQSKQQKYWIVRNSWGQYWGEMGYFRILMGSNVLGIESKIVWATPGNFTILNYPCNEDGSNCGPSQQEYVDPSKHPNSVFAQRLTHMEKKEDTSFWTGSSSTL